MENPSCAVGSLGGRQDAHYTTIEGVFRGGLKRAFSEGIAADRWGPAPAPGMEDSGAAEHAQIEFERQWILNPNCGEVAVSWVQQHVPFAVGLTPALG